jgi:site-specific DNA-methyltransferase (adenine-specific)
MKKLGDGTIDAVVATIDNVVATPGLDYLDWCKRWMTEVQRVLTSNGSLFLNVEDSPSDPGISFAIADEAQKLGFHLQNRIAWIKSIRIDGEVHTVDHIKHVEGDEYCNITSEFVFHLTKTGNVELDRYCEGVGVPYADPSNLTRWKHKRTRKCRGNTWFMPRSELAEKLLLLIGIKPGQTVLECGDIGTAAACRKLGIECVSI